MFLFYFYYFIFQVPVMQRSDQNCLLFFILLCFFINSIMQRSNLICSYRGKQIPYSYFFHQKELIKIWNRSWNKKTSEIIWLLWCLIILANSEDIRVKRGFFYFSRREWFYRIKKIGRNGKSIEEKEKRFFINWFLQYVFKKIGKCKWINLRTRSKGFVSWTKKKYLWNSKVKRCFCQN